MKTFAVSIAVLFIWTACGDGNQPIIDREALVERNSPVVTAFDSLASLSVGNGEFAYTVDIPDYRRFRTIIKKEFHWERKASGAGIASPIRTGLLRKKP